MTTEIRIKIDTDLLRLQRNTLIKMVEGPLTIEQDEHLTELIRLLDSMLDHVPDETTVGDVPNQIVLFKVKGVTCQP